MIKKSLIIVALLFIFACSSSPSEMLKTAEFEQKQNNKAHAIELYEEIIKKHPQSKETSIAKERLAELKK